MPSKFRLPEIRVRKATETVGNPRAKFPTRGTAVSIAELYNYNRTVAYENDMPPILCRGRKMSEIPSEIRLSAENLDDPGISNNDYNNGNENSNNNNNNNTLKLPRFVKKKRRLEVKENICSDCSEGCDENLFGLMSIQKSKVNRYDEFRSSQDFSGDFSPHGSPRDMSKVRHQNRWDSTSTRRTLAVKPNSLPPLKHSKNLVASTIDISEPNILTDKKSEWLNGQSGSGNQTQQHEDIF